MTPEILQVIERHTRDYTPFEVYIRALHEFCRGHRLTANEWEAAGVEQGGNVAVFPVREPTEEAGETRWYLYHFDKQAISEEPAGIVAAIRSTPETPRNCVIERETLSGVRDKIEKHIKNSFLKAMQAPIGVKPILKAWMELN